MLPCFINVIFFHHVSCLKKTWRIRSYCCCCYCLNERANYRNFLMTLKVLNTTCCFLSSKALSSFVYSTTCLVKSSSWYSTWLAESNVGCSMIANCFCLSYNLRALKNYYYYSTLVSNKPVNCCFWYFAYW